MASERNICKPIPGNMQLLFDSGKIYWGEEIACVTQAQNGGSLVILRIASVSIGLDKTIFSLRIVLAAWLVVPEVLTQKNTLMNVELLLESV